MLMLCAEWVVGCCSCPRGLQELQHAPADYTLPVSPEATAGPWPGHLLSPRKGRVTAVFLCHSPCAVPSSKL